MSDDRTTEQQAADEALTAAVRQIAEAYASESDAGWMLTEYLVVYATQGWDDDGDQCTSLGTATMDGTTPIHRLLGLADYAGVRYRKLLVSD